VPRPVIFGSALVAVMLPVHLLVPEPVSVKLAALTLGLIAGAYIGFAAADGRLRVIVTELAVACLFALGGLVGLLGQPLAIPAAIFLHAGWDLVHHQNRVGARIPQWYIPFCVIIDIVVGVVLFAYYWR